MVGHMWRLRLVEAAGYAMLVPWVVVHTAYAPLSAWQATAALFMLPLVAMIVGMAGMHSLLWSKKGRAAFGVLVVLSSLCLIGSILSSAVLRGSDETARVRILGRDPLTPNGQAASR